MATKGLRRLPPDDPKPQYQPDRKDPRQTTCGAASANTHGDCPLAVDE